MKSKWTRVILADTALASGGRSAAGKVPMLGLLKRSGKVHVVMVPNARSETLIPIIKERICPDSIVYTDSFKVYDVLDISEFRHLRINHSRFIAEAGNHINGIKNFGNQAMRYLRSYNGTPKNHFHLFIKECEWRFDYRPVANMQENLLK